MESGQRANKHSIEYSKTEKKNKQRTHHKEI